MNPLDLSAIELLDAFDSKRLSSSEVVANCLDEIEKRDVDVGAFVSVLRDSAMAQAADVDRRRTAGESVGRLAGIPVAVKDLICVEGEVTTCGSRILANYRPPFDATVIARLRQEDAVLIGKTNLDEFAMGSSTEHSAIQPTGNPWDLERTPGGSSGGSAASVAARMCPLAIGTDTGGSIRQPASFCGIVGLKPTYGRVSRYGLVAYASSLDQIGPFARTAEDAALLLECIAGQDPRDSTCSEQAVASLDHLEPHSLAGMRIGRVQQHFAHGLDPEIAAAIDAACNVMADLGAELIDVSLPNLEYGVATYYIIAPCEASSNLARYDGAHYGVRASECRTLDDMYTWTRDRGFGDEVKRRILLGTYALSEGYYDAYYLKALRVRRLIRDDFQKAFESVDLLLGPTTPSTAFRIGEKTDDPLEMYLADIYTVPANLAGVPAISVPCGFDSGGLPIGLQLQAPAFDERSLLRVASALQHNTDWHDRRPK